MPQDKHSWLLQLTKWSRSRQIALALQNDVPLAGGQLPDIVVFAWERIPGDNGMLPTYSGCSDWTIKILPRPEPDQSYWNILHFSNTVAIWWSDEHSMLVYPPGQQPGCYDRNRGCALPFQLGSTDAANCGDLFAWLKTSGSGE